jgi:hypothetical protein
MITTQQAKIFLKLLHGRFSIAWEHFYKSLFFRIFNGDKSFTQQFTIPQIVPIITSIDDLALLALNCNNDYCKKCFDLIKSTLTPEQMLELLKCMMHLTASGVIAPRNVADLFRGDTIASYILDELLKPSKKKQASLIEYHYYNYIDLIYQDLVKGKSLPDNIPPDYIMSDDCQKNSLNLLTLINQEIIKFIHTDPLISYFIGLIKHYVLQDKSFKIDNLNQFLLGTLANRFISSMFNRHIKRHTEKTINNLLTSNNPDPNSPNIHLAKKFEYQQKIAIRYGTRLFTQLISSDIKGKSSQNNVYPTRYNEFLTDPANRQPYIDYCILLNLSVKEPAPKFINKIKSKFAPKIQSDVYGQELQLLLWVTVKEIYVEYLTLKSKFNISHSNAEPELKLRYLPTCISELRNLLNLQLNLGIMNTPEWNLIDGLIKKLETLDKFYKENITYISKESSHDSTRSPPKWSLSPRASVDRPQPQIIGPKQSISPPKESSPTSPRP